MRRIFSKSARSRGDGGDRSARLARKSSSLRSPGALSDLDETVLLRARTDWAVGNWEALAAQDESVVEANPDRERLALLVAYAHQQLGNEDKARAFVMRALEWGCDKTLVARLLISSLHNTLGRICALRSDHARTLSHFENALAVAGGGQARSVGHTRMIREMANFGLLPQAAELVQARLNSLTPRSERPARLRAEVDMLKTEIGLLQHELMLAHKRNQIGSASRESRKSPQEDQSPPQEIERRSPSQLGQDLWVLERTNYKRGGFFVEIGASDGVTLSNTYLLETEFGWRGICAEPNPAFFTELRRNRQCLTVQECLAARSGERVRFVLADAFGSMVGYAAADMHADKRHPFVEAERVIEVTTVSLDDLLERCSAPRSIDYVSVDTEGSEYDILRDFPFEKWNVRLFTIEHNFTVQRQAIRELMARNGYECTERDWDDWYWRSDAMLARA